MSDYKPPYTITTKVISLIGLIGEAIGKQSIIIDNKMSPKLRRINKIKTVQASCEIEGNNLKEEQVSALIEGKRVLGVPSEIQEVTNALSVYDNLGVYNPYSLKDLKKAHKILMNGLLGNPGELRKGGVGIKREDVIIHMAPPADNVPFLLNDLFSWINNCDEHPLILSSVFHYEFEYIHPFPDGNGRLGRFWQTALLSKWNPIFQLVPIESIIRDNQERYYQALNSSTNSGSVNPFLIFMLEVILEALKVNLDETPQVTPYVTPQVKELLSILKGKELSVTEICNKLNLKDRKSLVATRIKPAMDYGLIVMTIPDKPRSKNQRYRLK